MKKHNARERICQALLNLVDDHRFSEITVEEIIALAGINRSTFYYHYCDKYALRDDIVEDLMSQLKDSIPLRPDSGHIPEISEIVRALSGLHARKDLFLRLTNPNWEVDTISLSNHYFAELALLWANAQISPNYPPELFAQIYAASATATVLWAFQSGADEQIVAQLISNHLHQGFFRAYTDKDNTPDSDK